MSGWVILGAVVALCVLIRLAMPWLERNDWIFPKGQAGTGGSSGALFSIATELFNPGQKRATVERQQAKERRADNLGQGDGNDPYSGIVRIPKREPERATPDA